MSQSIPPIRSIRMATFVGSGAGAVIGALAIIIALASTGAGHGDYIGARLLFPFSMLLMLLEDAIGPIAIMVGLLQFPLYGAVIGRALFSNAGKPIHLLASIHFVAVMACFSGILADFS